MIAMTTSSSISVKAHAFFFAPAKFMFFIITHHYGSNSEYCREN